MVLLTFYDSSPRGAFLDRGRSFFQLFPSSDFGQKASAITTTRWRRGRGCSGGGLGSSCGFGGRGRRCSRGREGLVPRGYVGACVEVVRCMPTGAGKHERGDISVRDEHCAP